MNLAFWLSVLSLVMYCVNFIRHYWTRVDKHPLESQQFSVRLLGAQWAVTSWRNFILFFTIPLLVVLVQAYFFWHPPLDYKAEKLCEANNGHWMTRQTKDIFTQLSLCPLPGHDGSDSMIIYPEPPATTGYCACGENRCWSTTTNTCTQRPNVTFNE